MQSRTAGARPSRATEFDRSGKKYNTIAFPTAPEFVYELRNSGLAHVLLGTRPGWYSGISDANGDIAAEVAAFLAKAGHGRTLNPDFTILREPDTQVRPRMLILHKDAAMKAIAQVPEVFGLGAQPTANEIKQAFADLCKPENISATLDDDAKLGRLIGFGGNADLYVEADRLLAKHMATLTDRHLGTHELNMARMEAGMRIQRSLGSQRTRDTIREINRDLAPDQVRPYAATLWDGDETTRIANRNMDGVFTINQKVDAAHMRSVAGDPDARKADTLVDLGLDALYGSSRHGA